MQYTFKDYERIFEYLRSKATELSDGQWTDFTDGDFGTVVIHLLSYWGDIMSNQLDLTASELFLNTAEERTSLMEIVKLVGYEPSHYQSAVAFVNLEYQRSENEEYEPLTLPSFTQFVTNDNSLSYYNLFSTTLSDDITTVAVYEGTKISKNFYYDDIDQYGRISLGDYYVGTNTVRCDIVSGVISGNLPRVTDVRFTTGEMCFSVHVDLDGIPYIQLPTSWKTSIVNPTTFNVTYLRTNGANGRTGANTITRVANTTVTSYTITNPEASVGGYNPETVTEIKTKASVFARTMYTIVTLKDFEDMSLFINDILQVKALDYNNVEEDFPPTIPAYKQPSPPNGVPNDAYKVLILAVPSNVADQTIFMPDDNGTYSKLTVAATQLHNLYMERKSATLYLEYRDPIYIDPWLILNIYMDPNNLNLSAVPEDVIDFIKLRYSRSRVKIGQSIYGSVIGKDILNGFSYIDYVEIRDPEYNIEAKPYEYLDVVNGYFMVFVNDSIKYVPKGLQLVNLRKNGKIRVQDKSVENSPIVEIPWCSQEIYESNPSYFPNSYKYLFDKSTGDYPRPDLTKLGVSWEEDGALLKLIIPDEMLDFEATQYFYLDNDQEYLHIYNSSDINNLITYANEESQINVPNYVTVELREEEGFIRMVNMFTSAYTGVKVKQYGVNINHQITLTQPNGDKFSWTNLGYNTEILGEPDQIYFENNGIVSYFYVPFDWEVEINEVE